MILSCKCINEYQDQKYGQGKRVFNKMKAERMYRCTVCKAEKKK